MMRYCLFAATTVGSGFVSVGVVSVGSVGVVSVCVVVVSDAAESAPSEGSGTARKRTTAMKATSPILMLRFSSVVSLFFLALVAALRLWPLRIIVLQCCVVNPALSISQSSKLLRKSSASSFDIPLLETT